MDAVAVLLDSAADAIQNSVVLSCILGEHFRGDISLKLLFEFINHLDRLRFITINVVLFISLSSRQTNQCCSVCRRYIAVRFALTEPLVSSMALTMSYASMPSDWPKNRERVNWSAPLVCLRLSLPYPFVPFEQVSLVVPAGRTAAAAVRCRWPVRAGRTSIGPCCYCSASRCVLSSLHSWRSKFCCTRRASGRRRQLCSAVIYWMMSSVECDRCQQPCSYSIDCVFGGRWWLLLQLQPFSALHWFGGANNHWTCWKLSRCVIDAIGFNCSSFVLFQPVFHPIQGCDLFLYTYLYSNILYAYTYIEMYVLRWLAGD